MRRASSLLQHLDLLWYEWNILHVISHHHVSHHPLSHPHHLISHCLLAQEWAHQVLPHVVSDTTSQEWVVNSTDGTKYAYCSQEIWCIQLTAASVHTAERQLAAGLAHW